MYQTIKPYTEELVRAFPLDTDALRSPEASAILAADQDRRPVTDGEIAAINLESARRGAWTRFARHASDPRVVEAIVDMEHLAIQFLGDLDALDRLDTLASQFARVDDSYRAALIQAEAASTAHRFDEARTHLSRAARLGGPVAAIERQQLTIDQACSLGLDAVLASRRRIASASGRVEDLVPLGAVLADLERFDEADAIYRRAFQSYDGVSPFLLAWICFQLGMLWGELVSAPNVDLAAFWYQKAIGCLPVYVKARVHLAEIYAAQDRMEDAEGLLVPAVSSGDPEVHWHLADVLTAQRRFKEAQEQLDFARSGFDALLSRHPLAFADHAAEFYSARGDDRARALAFARLNLANRPTRRALSQVHAIAKPKSGERA